MLKFLRVIVGFECSYMAATKSFQLEECIKVSIKIAPEPFRFQKSLKQVANLTL